MPQFDHLSFLNQVFWTLLIFSNFYFFTSYFILSKLSKILKFRSKKVQLNNISNSNLILEQFQSIKSANDAYNRALQNSENDYIYKKDFFFKKVNSINNAILKPLSVVNIIYKFNRTISILLRNL